MKKCFHTIVAMISFAGMLFIGATLAQATNSRSPYVSLEDREIKSMSREQKSRYLAGEGFPIALTGELNKYPGPKDSLKLQRQLKLNKKQRRQTRLIFERMRADSIKFGTLIVNREKKLNKLFASKRARYKSVKKLVLEIAKLKGRLRLAHLKYHMQMRRLLSKKQIASYYRLQGYQSK